MSDIHDGGCACGAVRYRVNGDPVVGTVCHCTFCQKRLASAFAVLALFKQEAIEVLQGELSEVEHRSDVSGRWLRMRFCRKCGTTISHTAELRPGMRAIAAGTFDDPNWFRIDRHIWTQSKLPWVVVPEGVEFFPQSASAPAR
ncbi:MAG TPA: GFA family protein [Burkholderiales bacterium]|jgi:hypothetical protein|nr:GFA family protein [Burkholderiales bacterium]